MKEILAEDERATLDELARANVLLGFDFDGTLAPIVADPTQAVLAPGTRALLARLAELYPCVVISGRALADVERRLSGVPLRGVIGNHGLEPWRATEELRRRVESWRARLAEPLAALEGVDVEDKRYSLAIHYRRAHRNPDTLAAIARALGPLDDARVIGGKQVVNVIPTGAPHKGVALERERDRLGCDSALFVGDDETDEDVFALQRPGKLVTVHVGPSVASLARYCLRRQSEIDLLLERLIELRRDADFVARAAP